MCLTLYCVIMSSIVRVLLVDLMDCMHHYMCGLQLPCMKGNQLITFNPEILPFCTRSDPIFCIHFTCK